MNINKIFIPWMLVSVIASIIAAVQIYRTSGGFLWVAVLLAALPLPAYLMAYIMPGKVARTAPRLPGLQALTAASFIGVLYMVFGQPGPIGFEQLAAIGIAANGAAFVQWFVWVFSSYGREASPQIVTGKTLPLFSLTRLDGTEVFSTAFEGRKTLLVFFRGNWCPLCMAQLGELHDQAARLIRAGVQVKFISNQGIEQSEKLRDKLNLPQNFEILQDDDLATAKALRIEDIGGAPVGMGDFPSDTVMATVIALDEQGRVIFGDETDNYRVRPHPDTFLPVFEEGSDVAEPSLAQPA